VTGADLGQTQCGASWEDLRSGWGQKFQIPAGAGRVKICGWCESGQKISTRAGLQCK